MFKQSSHLLLSVLFVSLVVPACSVFVKNNAKNGFKKQKVVYHLNDVNSAHGVLRNIKNHLNAVGQDNVEIIAVAHSSGAYALVMGTQDRKGRPFDVAIRSLARRGVTFQLCANTVRNKKIPKTSIDPNAKLVPSGVAQLINLQQQGYLYIKP